MTTAVAPAQEADRARSPRRAPRSPVLVVGVVLLAALVAVALLAPLLAVHDPRAITGRALERPSSRHWLGTDVPGTSRTDGRVFAAAMAVTLFLAGYALVVRGTLLARALLASTLVADFLRSAPRP